jgi:hypothetical protein
MRPRPIAPVISLNNTRDTLFSSIAIGNQWYYNGIPINGASAQTLAISANGVYFSIVTGLNGCPSDTSNKINITNVGVGDFSDLNLRLYPNPTSGETWLEFNLQKVMDLTIEVTNAVGAVVKSYNLEQVQSVSKYKLDLADISEGVYFVNIKSDKSFVSKKLLIAR